MGAMGTPRPATSSVFARLTKPSASVTDVAERRRVRLVTALQLAQLTQFVGFAVFLRLTETGPTAVVAPLVLAVAVVIIAAAYALTRTRHARLGFWAYVSTIIVINPVIMLLMGRAGAPFISIAFLVPSILVASIVASARGTLAAGLAGLAAMVVSARIVGPASWDEGVRHGILFIVANLGLIIVVGIHRDRVEADRSAELRARNEELEALRRTLEQKVVERTAELGARNVEMRLVLDHIAQGLFTVDRLGAFSSEPSATFSAWFGRPARGDSFVEFLGRHSPRFAAAAAGAWQQVADDFLPVELTLAQFPSTLVANGRQYSFSFEPIGEGEGAHFLVVVSDVTAEFEREGLLRERRETFALFERMIADRPHFVAFFDEATALVARVLAPEDGDPGYARDLHTLKGNALLFGLESVGEICHALETQTVESRRLPSAVELAGLEERWARLRAEVDRLLGERKYTIEISPEQHAALERAAREGGSPGEVLRLVRALRLDSVDGRLQHFAEQARRIADGIGKKVTVAVSGNDVRVEGQRWAPLWAAFVHAVRNAVDHGIEAPAERVSAGKAECGSLSLRARGTATGMSLEVEDDGRGIDWEAVRRRGAALGMNVSTDEALADALFADGLSTAEEVTDLSGRGVGMGALRAAVRDQGGELVLRSHAGAGTLLRMTFPDAPAPAL
ncbi:MAG: Signal transduction histidine kinase CheA [Myxococcaceae bacterium]|nr:Signal transduction histidine kinase CheA [Myxococcaceae bacterium]